MDNIKSQQQDKASSKAKAMDEATAGTKTTVGQASKPSQVDKPATNKDTATEMKSSKDQKKAATKPNKQAQEIKQLMEKLQQSQDMNLRLHAEIQNLHKRSIQEQGKAHLGGMLEFAPILLETLDNLEKALGFYDDKQENKSAVGDAVRQGVELTYKTLQDGLKRLKIEEINPVGEKFNPEYHEALTKIKIKGKPSDTVIAVIQKGYVLKGRLLRAAKVQVAE